MSTVSRPSGSGADGFPESIATDPANALALLKNDRRRLTIHIVAAAYEQDLVLDIRSVTDAIAPFENDCAERELGSQQRKRVYIGLQQTHVPRLARDGAVEIDDPDRQSEIYANGLTHDLDQAARAIEAASEGDVIDVTFDDGQPVVISDV